MLGINEWLMWLMHSMYENTRISRCVGWNLGEEFSVKVSGQQNSCPRSLLFITVLEAPFKSSTNRISLGRPEYRWGGAENPCVGGDGHHACVV